MIYDLRKKTSRNGKEVYQFALQANILGDNVTLTGWIYLPDSHRVYGPSVQYNGQWHNIVQDIPISLKKQLANLVSALLTEEPLTEQLKKNPDKIRKEYPTQFRDLFIEAYPETKELFEDLPPGRKWPTAILKQRAEKIHSGEVEFEEHEDDVKYGVLSEEDDNIVHSFLDQLTAEADLAFLGASEEDNKYLYGGEELNQ